MIVDIKKVGCIAITLSIIFVLSLAILATYVIFRDTQVQVVEENADTIVEVQEIQDTISDWEIMKMALIEVESEFKSFAISEKGAVGIYQITSTYVKDVNRITGNDFTLEDAQNDEIANYMFEIIQRQYNSNKDILKAIRLHNPKAGTWYEERIFVKIEEIKRREEIRKLVQHYAD